VISGITPLLKSPAANKAPSLININQRSYLNYLALTLNKWEHSLSLSSPDSIDRQIERLSLTMVNCARRAKVKNPPIPLSKAMPWWSNELCALRSKARSSYKAWSRTKLSSDESLYHRSKANYQRALRRAKGKAWADFRALASPGDTFKVLSSFSGKSKSIPVPSELTVNGAVTTDPSIITKACADHFFPFEPPSDIAHSAIIDSAKSALNLSDSAVPPISDWEFESAFKTLNKKSAPGYDGISADLLLCSLPVIKPLLFKILNACLLLSFFPCNWKLSKVIVIRKPNKPEYSTLNSFRPISLVSNLAKLLEKVILGHLIWYSRSLNWISDFQHGFREGRSTDSAAHSLTFFIESAFVERKVCAAAFLDIKSAFDSAWHPAIIASLAKRSCPGSLLKIVQSFLSNRVAVISVQDSTFSKSISLGCPQGGVLSPFLWNMLVDDLIRLTFDFPVKFIAYADDITIITAHKDPAIATRNLQIVCDTVVVWLRSRKLYLNALKSVLVVFSRKRIALNNLNICINNIMIFPSLSVHFLGLIVDANLKWKDHLNAKCVSAKRALLMVNSCLRQSFGFDCMRLRSLYLSNVEPILSYGCSVWLSILKTQAGMKTLRSFQRFAARLFTRSFKTAPTDSLLVLANLLPLDLHLLKLVSLRYLSMNLTGGLSPSSLKILSERVPLLIPAQRIPPVNSLNLPELPPWAIKVFTSSMLGVVVPLLPTDRRVLRLTIHTSCKGTVASFCVVASNSLNVLDVCNSCCLP
jgi:hypothetical protein